MSSFDIETYFYRDGISQSTLNVLINIFNNPHAHSQSVPCTYCAAHFLNFKYHSNINETQSCEGVHLLIIYTTCFGRCCDHLQGISWQEYNQHTNNIYMCMRPLQDHSQIHCGATWQKVNVRHNRSHKGILTLWHFMVSVLCQGVPPPLTVEHSRNLQIAVIQVGSTYST